MTINPSFAVHSMYTATDSYIADYQIIEMTRFRLGSHRLIVETGRWCRTPADRRLCTCNIGGVQDEAHVVYRCEYTNDLREKFLVDVNKQLHEILGDSKYVNFVYEIMKTFK